MPNFPNKSEVKLSDAIVNEACIVAKNKPNGPVHVNIPLAEPLYETEITEVVPNINKPELAVSNLTTVQENTIKEAWLKAKKKMVLIGQMHAGELDISHLAPILNDPSVAILVENTSNIKDFTRICHCIDRTLAIISEDDLEQFSPDLIVTMGGAVVSKKIKAFLSRNKPQTNWRVGQFLIEEDTFQSLTASFKVAPKKVLNYIGSLANNPLSNFGSKWKQRDFLAQEMHEEFLTTVPYSDLAVFNEFFESLPINVNLHMSNSSVVRYCQLFNPIRGADYYANRGVSGIDGSSSTAAGIACCTPSKLNVLITGDISFFYDSNALWNAYLKNNFRIVLINNGGGGIFKIIDGPRKSKQAEQFVAPYSANAKGICDAYNVGYSKVSSLDQLAESLDDLFKDSLTSKPRLLEVDTTEVENEKFLKDYFAKIATKA